MMFSSSSSCRLITQLLLLCGLLTTGSTALSYGRKLIVPSTSPTPLAACSFSAPGSSEQTCSLFNSIGSQYYVENDPVWGAALRCYPSSLAPGTSVASTPDVNTTTSNPSASDIAWWIAGLPVLGPVAYGSGGPFAISLWFQAHDAPAAAPTTASSSQQQSASSAAAQYLYSHMGYDQASATGSTASTSTTTSHGLLESPFAPEGHGPSPVTRTFPLVAPARRLLADADPTADQKVSSVTVTHLPSSSPPTTSSNSSASLPNQVQVFMPAAGSIKTLVRDSTDGPQIPAVYLDTNGMVTNQPASAGNNGINPFQVSPGMWHHLVITTLAPPSSGSASGSIPPSSAPANTTALPGYALYLDGVRMGILGSDGSSYPDAQAASPFTATGGDPMQFGSAGIHLCIGADLLPASLFRGLLSHLKIFNTSLTPDQVTALHVSDIAAMTAYGQQLQAILVSGATSNYLSSLQTTTPAQTAQPAATPTSQQQQDIVVGPGGGSGSSSTASSSPPAGTILVVDSGTNNSTVAVAAPASATASTPATTQGPGLAQIVNALAAPPGSSSDIAPLPDLAASVTSAQSPAATGAGTTPSPAQPADNSTAGTGTSGVTGPGHGAMGHAVDTVLPEDLAAAGIAGAGHPAVTPAAAAAATAPPAAAVSNSSSLASLLGNATLDPALAALLANYTGHAVTTTLPEDGNSTSSPNPLLDPFLAALLANYTGHAVTTVLPEDKNSTTATTTNTGAAASNSGGFNAAEWNSEVASTSGGSAPSPMGNYTGHGISVVLPEDRNGPPPAAAQAAAPPTSSASTTTISPSATATPSPSSGTFQISEWGTSSTATTPPSAGAQAAPANYTGHAVSTVLPEDVGQGVPAASNGTAAAVPGSTATPSPGDSASAATPPAAAAPTPTTSAGNFSAAAVPATTAGDPAANPTWAGHGMHVILPEDQMLSQGGLSSTSGATDASLAAQQLAQEVDLVAGPDDGKKHRLTMGLAIGLTVGAVAVIGFVAMALIAFTRVRSGRGVWGKAGGKGRRMTSGESGLPPSFETAAQGSGNSMHHNQHASLLMVPLSTQPHLSPSAGRMAASLPNTPLRGTSKSATGAMSALLRGHGSALVGTTAAQSTHTATGAAGSGGTGGTLPEGAPVSTSTTTQVHPSFSGPSQSTALATLHAMLSKVLPNAGVPVTRHAAGGPSFIDTSELGSITTRSKSSRVSKMISMGRLRRGGVPSISEGGAPLDHTALAMPALDENQAAAPNTGAAAPPTLVLPSTNEIVPHIDATDTSALRLPQDTVTFAPHPPATTPGNSLFNYVSSLLHVPGSAQRRTQACLAAATGNTSGLGPAGGVITEEGIAFGTTSEGGARATLVKHELHLSLPATGAARHKKEHDSGDEGPIARSERAGVSFLDSPRTLEHRHLLVSPKPTHSASNPLAGDPVAFTSQSSFTAPATRRAGRAAAMSSGGGANPAGSGGGASSLVIPPNMVGPHYPQVLSPGSNTYREDGEGGFAIGSPILRGGDMNTSMTSGFGCLGSLPGSRSHQARQLGYRPASHSGTGPLPAGSPPLSGVVPMSPGRQAAGGTGRQGGQLPPARRSMPGGAGPSRLHERGPSVTGGHSRNSSASGAAGPSNKQE